MAEAGWYADPQGRYELRYHDGSAWTEHVSTGGVASTDGGAAPPAITGASLYGTPGYVSPSAVGTTSAYSVGAGSAPKPMMVGRNTVGMGLAVAVAGWLVMLAATLLPWIEGEALWALSSNAYSTVQGSGLVSGLQGQVAVSLLWMILVIVGTTLPYQPGKVVGFFMGGCIGLIVCWNKLDAHAKSIRSNLLGIFVVILHGVSISYALVQVTDDAPGYEGGDVGAGPWVLGLGLGLVAFGALIGRRYRRVAV